MTADGLDVVTGGSGAIGTELVSRLLSEGRRVLATTSSQAGSARLHELGARFDGRLIVASVDLASSDGVLQLMSVIDDLADVPRTFVSMSSGASAGPLENFGDEELRRLLYSKVWAAERLATRLGALMSDAGHGRVVFFTGITGREPRDGYAVGAASNAALRVVTKTLSRRWADRGVTVNAVCPGPVDSPRLRQVATALDRDTGEDRIDAGAGQPMGRLVSPREVANVVRFVLSAESSGINGAEIVVDGGFTRSL